MKTKTSTTSVKHNNTRSNKKSAVNLEADKIVRRFKLENARHDLAIANKRLGIVKLETNEPAKATTTSSKSAALKPKK